MTTLLHSDVKMEWILHLGTKPINKFFCLARVSAFELLQADLYSKQVFNIIHKQIFEWFHAVLTFNETWMIHGHEYSIIGQTVASLEHSLHLKKDKKFCDSAWSLNTSQLSQTPYTLFSSASISTTTELLSMGLYHISLKKWDHIMTTNHTSHRPRWS